MTEVVTADQIAKRRIIADLLGQVSVLQAQRLALRDKFNALRGQVDYDPVALRSINAVARGIDHQIAGLGESAVALTLEVYGIAPNSIGRRILDESDFKDSTARWGVLFSQSRSYTTWNPARKEYQTFKFSSPGVLGMTWPDGAIMVTERALASPGILAATLVHETVHFDQRTGAHGTRIGGFEREVSAFGSVVSNEVKLKLGLTESDVSYLVAAHRSFMGNPDGYLPQAIGGGSPLVGPDLPDESGFGDFRADGEAVARLYGSSSRLRGSIEEAAASRSREFVDRMNAGANTVAAGFRTEAASHCNLMAVDAEADQYKVRAGRGQPVILRYADADGFYVAALLAQACTADWQTSSCNDAMPILSRRWQEPEFRQSVMLAVGSDDEVNGCFWYLARNLKPTGDFQIVREKVAKFKALTRKEPDSSPTPPPVTPRTPREPREPRPTLPPDVPHCRRSGPWCEDPAKKP